MAFTFKGGLRFPQRKHTKKCASSAITSPIFVKIPLAPYPGAICLPCVKEGEDVCMGQVIGRCVAEPSCPVHASVSGTVTEIAQTSLKDGRLVPAVVIKNDFKERIHPAIKPFDGKAESLTVDTVLDVIKNAGIVDTGKNPLPVHHRLSCAAEKVSALIINCTETEPYLTARYRLLLEHPEKIVGGIKILLKALSMRSAVVAFDKTNMDAVKALANQKFEKEMLRICIMKNKYPQGNAPLLLSALSGKKPLTEQSVSEAGYLIFDAEVCAAIYDAFVTGTPFIRRIVTVDGDCISSPANMIVPIGTPISEVLDECMAETEKINTLIFGDPMNGCVETALDAPVTGDCTALLAFSKKQTPQKKATACIRCGRCIDRCPMRLLPSEIYEAKNQGDLVRCQKLSAENCISCGVCSYVCPAGLDLTAAIADAKLASLQSDCPSRKETKAEQEELS